ncbi:MAG: hypothetical protein CVV56_01765 [Tenericutes bacterium HGW-Tenericutes-1]|jgi:diguanylate cyclase (GGDEF)-like protein|nr:MAG: hypothetical protein CVV56_01765 [Tenericutes bacterium HGW-Tenericutes-1]
MLNNHFDVASNELREKYHIDIIKDVLLGKKDRVLLYGDVTNPTNIQLNLISGDLSLLGFESHDSLHFQDILAKFDHQNKYAEIAGKKEYFTYVTSALTRFNTETDITFPVSVNNNRIWLRINKYPLEKNPNICLFIMMNVTDLMNAEELIYEKTHKDSLTGLLNRYSFDYHYGLRHQWKNLHAIYMDLDDFKSINDKEGHAAGNEFLILFSHILKELESDYNRFYRLGGDEFVGLFFEDEKTVRHIAETIISKTKSIHSDKFHERVSVSIGIVKAIQAEDLIRKADEVLYKVKNAGKNHYLYEIEK